MDEKKDMTSEAVRSAQSALHKDKAAKEVALPRETVQALMNLGLRVGDLLRSTFKEGTTGMVKIKPGYGKNYNSVMRSIRYHWPYNGEEAKDG